MKKQDLHLLTLTIDREVKHRDYLEVLG